MDRTNENPLPPATFRGAADALGGPDTFARSLAQWAADAAVDEAAVERARARWMRLAADEEASMLGTLVNLAEAGRTVALDVGRQRLRGTIVGLGADFIALRSDQGQLVLVRTTSIAVVQAEPGSGDVRGDRSPRLDTTLVGVLGPLAADRPDIVVRTAADGVVRGVLRRAGHDVIGVRPDSDHPTPIWIAIDAIDVVVVDP